MIKFILLQLEVVIKLIKEIGKEYNLKFIETYFLLENDDFFDGLHPTTKGHTKLFEEIRKYFN